MKRLLYVTDDLDDAALISDEVHNQGVDDYHFFVLSRDEKGIKTHHLHGSSKLEKMKILVAPQRAVLLTVFILFTLVLGFVVFTDLFAGFYFLSVLLILFLGCVTFFTIKITSGSFDSYFEDLFNEHLNSGEVLIVIDLPKNQADEVESIINQHPKAKFIADSSNFNSPIPK